MKQKQVQVWPKKLPDLSEEQRRISDDFMDYWLTVLPRRYGGIERFNHLYALRTAKKTRTRTLDIGAGRGEHIAYENLAAQDYVALEMRPALAEAIAVKYPQVSVFCGNIQERLPFDDESFDRVLAIHLLEHLPNLPKALDEVHRLLRSSGRFSVVIPCEGGFAYTVARNISARRIFERRYHQKYDWFIEREHINRPHEVLGELQKRFVILETAYFPFLVPLIQPNLVIGMTLAKE